MIFNYLYNRWLHQGFVWALADRDYTLNELGIIKIINTICFSEGFCVLVNEMGGLGEFGKVVGMGCVPLVQ